MKPIEEVFPKAADVLREAAAVIEDRDASYGDNPVVHAELMALLTGDDPLNIQRASLFNMMGVKLSRYANNLREGHEDSLIDLITYAAALLVIDRERRG